jgi:hypothetical protein
MHIHSIYIYIYIYIYIGDQVAFDRVRHAQQDALIVKQMIKYKLMNWNYKYEKNSIKIIQKRNEKKIMKRSVFLENQSEEKKNQKKIKKNVSTYEPTSTYNEADTYSSRTYDQASEVHTYIYNVI